MTEGIYKQTLAAWLQRSREELGLSQMRVAGAVRVSRSAVSAWERGTRSPSVYQYSRLKRFFARQRAAAQNAAGKASITAGNSGKAASHG